MQPAPQPIAHGDLQQTPLLHILASLRRRKASGTLVIWSQDGERSQDRLLFADGELRAMRTSDPGLGIEQALRPLVDQAAGRYAFYTEDLVGEAVRAPAGLEFAPLIASLLRASTRLDGITRVLEARRAERLRIRRGHSRQSLGLDREEAEVFDVMRAAPVSPEELASRSGRPEVARRLLYLLELIDALEVHKEGSASSDPGRLPRVSSGSMPSVSSVSGEPGTPRQPSSSQSVKAQKPEPSQARLRLDSISAKKPEETLRLKRSSDGNVASPRDLPSPPESLSAEERERWLEIQAKYTEEDRANHFQFLGVAEDASTREIEAAFVGMAKLCHPDRLTPTLQALRPFADHLFRRATAAREVLLNAGERTEYLKLVKRDAGTPESERREREIVSAALDFAKVDALLRRKAFAEARTILDKNLELSPEIADYPAKKAQALTLEFGMDEPSRRAEIAGLLDRALKLDETHENANFLMGQLLKRMGDERAALAHFQACVESNPHHIDAARELRLARMRKPTPPDGTTSILGRLFKKK